MAATTRVVSVAELRTSTSLAYITTPDPTDIFYVKDPGMEGDFYYDSSDSVSPDDTGLVLVHTSYNYRFKRKVVTDYLSVKWFGAIGDGNANDQPAIQRTVNASVANRFLPKTVFLPVGVYKIDHPIIVCNFANNEYLPVTVLLRGEHTGVNRFSQLGSQIKTNFKTRSGGELVDQADRFAIGFQRGKSGGIQSITIIGEYVQQSISTAEFLNNTDFTDTAAYADPECRDTRFSPYAGVVIDPFKQTAPPATDGGGYPGYGYDGASTFLLSTYYTRWTSGSYNSGSSGLYFKDLNIDGFTVGMIQSPNGSTQQGDAIIYEDIKIQQCKLGFASCQDQEKANVYKNIVCWGKVHTLFSNQDYGAHTPGNVVIDNVNVAGGISRLMNWANGGYFPSFFSNIYGELFGSFGSLTSGGVTSSVENCVLNFANMSEGNYYPRFHLQVSKEITFRSCLMRIYGTGLPIIISGSGVFHECSFETVPFTRIEEWNSSADTTQFFNCMYSLNTNGKIGSREVLRGSINQFYNYNLYGDYSILDANAQRYNAYGEYAIKFHQTRAFIDFSTNISVSISGTNRSFSFTFGTAAFAHYFRVNEPVLLTQSGIIYFAGVVASSSAITGTVTVNYAPANIANGNYNVCANPAIKPFRVLGEVTAASNTVLNVVNGGFPGAVQDIVNLPEFGGYVVLTAVSGTTYTFSGNAIVTRNSATTNSKATLCPTAIQYRFNSLNPYSAHTAQISSAAVFKKGDEIVDTYQGVIRKYICISDGVFDQTDAQRARFTLEGMLLYSLSSDGSVLIPSNYLVEGFVLKSTATIGTLKIGTSSGASDIGTIGLTANVSAYFEWHKFIDSVTPFQVFFSDISGTLAIRAVLKAS